MDDPRSFVEDPGLAAALSTVLPDARGGVAGEVEDGGEPGPFSTKDRRCVHVAAAAFHGP